MLISSSSISPENPFEVAAAFVDFWQRVEGMGKISGLSRISGPVGTQDLQTVKAMLQHAFPCGHEKVARLASQRGAFGARLPTLSSEASNFGRGTLKFGFSFGRWGIGAMQLLGI